MSELSLIVVLQNKTSKIINGMANISIKSQKITPLGEIIHDGEIWPLHRSCCWRWAEASVHHFRIPIQRNSTREIEETSNSLGFCGNERWTYWVIIIVFIRKSVSFLLVLPVRAKSGDCETFGGNATFGVNFCWKNVFSAVNTRLCRGIFVHL